MKLLQLCPIGVFLLNFIKIFPISLIPCDIKQDEEEKRNCTNDCADCRWEEWERMGNMHSRLRRPVARLRM